DLSRRRDPRLGVERELLLTDRQDVVGIEAVERAQTDELVVALPPEGPVVRAAGQRALEPRPVVGHGRLGTVRGRPEAAKLRPAEDALAGGDHLVEQGRDLTGR